MDKHLIEFTQIALMRPDFEKTEDLFTRLLAKDHIAVVGLFENRSTGSRLVISNLHAPWDPEYRDVKLVQIGLLMDELEKLAAQFVKSVLCANDALAPFVVNSTSSIPGSCV